MPSELVTPTGAHGPQGISARRRAALSGPRTRHYGYGVGVPRFKKKVQAHDRIASRAEGDRFVIYVAAVAPPLAAGPSACFHCGMSLRDQHVEALLNETIAEYESVLPAAMLAELRGVLQDAFDVHPVMRALVDEHAPREHADKSGAQPGIDADDATDAADDGEANHG